MKTFSLSSLFILFCLASSLIMVEDVAHAAAHEKAELGVVIGGGDNVVNFDAETPPYQREFTNTLTDDDGDPVPDAKIDFEVIQGMGFVSLSATSMRTNKDGEATITLTFVPPAPSTTSDFEASVIIQGTLDIDDWNNKPMSIINMHPGVADATGFAGHDFVLKKRREHKEDPIYKTRLVVLPPIPCEPNYGAYDLDIRAHDNMLTPLSDLLKNQDPSIDLNEIKTHDELIAAIQPLRDQLSGLAARWDDPDPNADPPDPTDMEPPTDRHAAHNVFRVPIVILNAGIPYNNEGIDLNGWQFDIAFNPQILEVVEVTAGDYQIFEGNFLMQGGANTFFNFHEVNNAAGRIIRISQTRIPYGDKIGDDINDETDDLTPQGSDEWASEIDTRKNNDDSIDGATGTGELVSICFRVKEFAEESLGLHNLQLSDSRGKRLHFTTIVHPAVVTHQFAPEDVNRDTVVNTKDLMIIAASLGLARPINPRADVNNDGIINVLDLVIVAQHIEDRTPAVRVRPQNNAAPAGGVAALDPATIQGWIDKAHLEDDGSVFFDLGIAKLEALIVAHVPAKTKLMLNYPNPFNPETWIPYQLAEATEVTISIYALNGNLIRTIALGHKSAGTYQSKSQAAYWNGRNDLGERVASGVYFYTFTAGKFSATGKMLVRK